MTFANLHPHAYTIALMVLFWAGFAAHVWKRADLSALSPISQGTSRWQYVNRNLSSIIFRLGTATCFFFAWREGSLGNLPLLSSQFGVALPNFLNSMLPATLWTTPIYGGAADWLWDWIVARFRPAKEQPK